MSIRVYKDNKVYSLMDTRLVLGYDEIYKGLYRQLDTSCSTESMYNRHVSIFTGYILNLPHEFFISIN